MHAQFRNVRASILFTWFCVITLLGFGSFAGAVESRGKVDAVTVYRGQALVTRLVDVPGPAGLKEMVVVDLPEQVQPGSIYAEAVDGIEVRSVSYRVRPVENDVREEVQKLQQQIQAMADKIAASQRHLQVLQAQGEYLSKLEQFTAGTSTAELTKGVLNAETLQKMTQFQFEQRSRICDEELKLNGELRGLNEQMDTLKRELGQIATSSSKLSREAVVFCNVAGAAGRLRLRYLVAAATWQPSYNIRAGSAGDKVTVEYLGSIQQMSGEDWEDVQMTLSTATPSLVAKAPILTELAINLAKPGQSAQDVLAQLDASAVEQTRQELQLQRQTAGNNRGVQNSSALGGRGAGVSNFIGNNNELDQILNKTAGDLQMVDLLAKEQIARNPAAKGVAANPEEGLAIAYQLPNRTSLASRSDRQLIQIASLPLKALFYKVASPVLANYVYNEATVTNDSVTQLLAGEVATYVNNEFVGRGAIPSVAVGQNFNVGLGIDSSLRTRRELVEKNETMQGGNRVVDFTYRLTLENFGAKPASVRLLDRLPTAKEAEIRVTLVPPGKELSKDAVYEQGDRKKNILRWDLEVPAQLADDKALAVEYQFKLEYDRQMSITAPTSVGGGYGFGGLGGGRGGGNGTPASK
ncbi:MAG TPA: mucoidy inhibitor MuiA family protein [Tepidisphaeraceae bacterium]|nr:mucoidy inhibitor MuiA family protein [Tepidisphaeraceae bacterium]